MWLRTSIDLIQFVLSPLSRKRFMRAKMKSLLSEVGYWSFLLAGSVALSFTPWLVVLVVNMTYTDEQLHNLKRYQEELRQQGVDL